MFTKNIAAMCHLEGPHTLRRTPPHRGVVINTYRLN